MGCLWSVFRKLVLAICAVLKVALAVGIIVIVAVHLQDVTLKVDARGKLVDWNASCLMSGDVHGVSVCNYAYAVCGISLLASLVLSLFLCITCDACGLGSWFEFLAGGLLTAWWVIAAIVFSAKAAETHDAVPAVPNGTWRTAVVAMAWCCAGLAGMATLVYMVEALKCLGRCCGGCFEDGDEEDARRCRV